MANNQRTGRVFINLGGTLVESLDGAKLSNFQGLERDAVTGSDIFGYKEKVVVPTIEGEIAHGAGISTTDLMSLTDDTATFECDSGPVFILSNGWMAKVTDLTGGEGKFAFTFQAKKCVEDGVSTDD
jgi:hypothetical protein